MPPGEPPDKTPSAPPAAPSDDEIIRHVADELPVGVWVARAPGGEFVYANQTFAEIMGQAGREDVAVGEYAAPYGIHGRDGALYPEERMPFVQALRTRRTVVVDDIVIHRTDGGRIYIRAQARPCFDAAGTLTHVIIAFIDISREVEAERARAESEARLRQSQRMEAIGNLAGGIAHDFNNLLGAVKLVVERLLRGEVPPARLREELEVVDSLTDRAAGLTRSLLGFARRGKHLAERLSLNDVVRGLGELLRRSIESTSAPTVTVELRTDAETADVVGDYSQLEQVLANLMVNARDAIAMAAAPGVAATGRIVVRTREQILTAPDPEAQPHALAPGRYVVLEVSDTGGGVPLDLRERIFEPYFTTKLEGELRGTGLGLATVWGIVDAHGGAIRLASRPGATTFTVLLPSAPARVERRPTPLRVPAAFARREGLLLVADDEPLMRRALAGALEELGYAVLLARDSDEVEAIFRREHARIAAVVLDLVMPKREGRATFLALRAIDPNVRVLLTTGYALNEEAQAMLDLGVRGFLSKPASLEALDAAVVAVLERP